MAMLAKQCWRLLEDLDSLCAKVLRDSYYPGGNRLKAKLNSGSSCTWQSIIVGLETFRRGNIWRIRHGTQVDIWEDPLVSTSPNMKLMTPRGKFLVKKVCDHQPDNWFMG